MSKLIVSTILGFLALMLVLGLALFLSAGTLSFWQAWVYLVVWAVCVILITAYLMRFDQKLLAGRVNAGPIAETQKTQQLIQALASLLFIGLFIVPGLDFRFHWSHVSTAVSLISDGFVALGFLIVFLVFKENSFTRATIEVSDEQKVIATGPYSMVRHPMYAGAGILLLFTGPALGSWIAVACAVGVILVVVVRLLDEEKFLLRNLNGYSAYRQHVRYRLIPGIW
ncbi:MAG: methyltransferase family protein [Anaerolineales bacterium]